VNGVPRQDTRLEELRPLKQYRQRWSIECIFWQLESPGLRSGILYFQIFALKAKNVGSHDANDVAKHLHPHGDAQPRLRRSEKLADQTLLR